MMMQQRSHRDNLKEQLQAWSFDPTKHDTKEILAFSKTIVQDCGVMDSCVLRWCGDPFYICTVSHSFLQQVQD